ncbi:MAG: hypothetical protein KGL74_05815 [Elusimicrobia bacterium]|nr:hypothetical protein [Elusimicrobiota bacterium]
MNGEVPGSYSAAELAALPGFSMTTLVCPAQGEISEKNWRRAGEFDDIARALMAREQAAPPPAPAPALAVAAADVDSLIDTASTKLFSHVADLVKELENRREEKALIISLQRQIQALKEELGQTRERSNLLEMRLPRIAELEENQRKNHAALESLQASLLAREAALNETRITSEKMRNELDATKRRLLEASNDLAMRNKLVDKISKELSEKEMSLAKSLGVIRRLEEDLNRLCPDPALVAAALAAVTRPAARTEESRPAPAPAAPERAPARFESEPAALTGPAIPPAPEPLLPEASAPAGALPPSPTPYTLDEPPAPPPYIEPPVPGESPKAHQALLNFMKRIFPGQPH